MHFIPFLVCFFKSEREYEMESDLVLFGDRSSCLEAQYSDCCSECLLNAIHVLNIIRFFESVTAMMGVIMIVIRELFTRSNYEKSVKNIFRFKRKDIYFDKISSNSYLFYSNYAVFLNINRKSCILYITFFKH